MKFLARLHPLAEILLGTLAFTLWIAALWGWTVLLYAVRTQ